MYKYYVCERGYEFCRGKTSTVTKVVGSNVYYYSATTGASVESKKDFSGWRGPHRKGSNDLEFHFTVTYSQEYTVSTDVSSTMGWEEGVVATVSKNVGVAETEGVSVSCGTIMKVKKNKESGVYQMTQYVPKLKTTYTTKYSDLSGHNMKTKKTRTIAMPRVDYSYPDYYKKCDLANE